MAASENFKWPMLDELSPEDMVEYQRDLWLYGSAATIRGDDGVLRYIPLSELCLKSTNKKPRRLRRG